MAPIGGNLIHIERIKKDQLLFKPEEAIVKLICDVDNPLYGSRGAAYVYAPQKGASPEEVEWLDQGLRNLASRLQAAGLLNVGLLPGAGAAGGVGGGGVAFLGGEIHSGTATFLDISGLEGHIQQANVVVTGEGHLDTQTTQGKLISGVCKLAQKHGKGVIGVCGAADLGTAEALSLQKVFTIMERSDSLEEAMTKAFDKLVEIGQEIGRQL